MIQIAPQTRILVAIEAIDLRRGIDGLAQVCKDALKADPFICVAPRYVAADPDYGAFTCRVL